MGEHGPMTLVSLLILPHVLASSSDVEVCVCKGDCVLVVVVLGDAGRMMDDEK